LGKISFLIRNPFDPNKLPVIQPGPFQVSIAQGEARPAGDNQFHLRGGAEPGNVSGILRDLRFY
jgi:hypothetical protein